MQAVNWARARPEKKIELLKVGREHLELAVAVLKWLRRGGAILFEHPDGAASWQEPELQSLAAHAGVKTVVGDQCVFGLNVNGKGPNRKRTRWLSNMPQVIEVWESGVIKATFTENGLPRLAGSKISRKTTPGNSQRSSQVPERSGHLRPGHGRSRRRR